MNTTATATSVAVVTPHQARDLAKAFGKLASGAANKIDAFIPARLALVIIESSPSVILDEEAVASQSILIEDL